MQWFSIEMLSLNIIYVKKNVHQEVKKTRVAPVVNKTGNRPGKGVFCEIELKYVQNIFIYEAWKVQYWYW